VWQHSRCHNITEAQAEQDDFHFICKRCRRREEEAKQPKLPPLKLRLTSDSPSSRNASQTNGTNSTHPVRRAEAVEIPVPRPPVPQSTPQAPLPSLPPSLNGSVVQSASKGFPTALPLMNGPSLSPRGQALGPPGIERSEAAYGSPSHRANGNARSPLTHHYSASLNGGTPTTSGLPLSSPPRYQNPRTLDSPLNTYSLSFPRSGGSPFGGPPSFKVSHQSFGDNFRDSFSRPSSSAGLPGHSPVKHSPAPSPRPTNSIPNTYNFTNSPHSSFPPSSVQKASFSPTKHSSPPPPMAHMSSPVPTPALVRFEPSPRQVPAQMLPNPVLAPEKHDGARPISSHSMSETRILPPIKALSPTANPQILNPPTKKMSPTPERPRFTPVSGNGVGGQ